jgi:hypothetical protein
MCYGWRSHHRTDVEGTLYAADRVVRHCGMGWLGSPVIPPTHRTVYWRDRNLCFHTYELLLPGTESKTSSPKTTATPLASSGANLG